MTDSWRKDRKTDAGVYGFSPANSGTENTQALNRAIAENGTVTVTENGVYDMAGTVKISSDSSVLFAPGVVLRRTALRDAHLEGNLFINEGAFAGRYNENILLSGAHIEVNGVESAPAAAESVNVIAGLRGHIAFFYIRNLRLENTTVTGLMQKDYAVQISDFENAEVDRIFVEGLKDGVHFGPGRNFTVRNGVFRTYDDAIALNCADYSVSNPNFGSIRDGLIENCVELPGYKTEAFFIRILVGTPRVWKKGMTVYHSDAILTDKGMYRVVMRADNTPYISQTKPDFDCGYETLDGITWVRTHLGHPRAEIESTAGCENVTVRNLTLLQARRRGAYIYSEFDEYLRSYYSGSVIPEVKDIRFENVNLMAPFERFLAVNVPVKNLSFSGGNISREDVLYEDNPQIP